MASVEELSPVTQFYRGKTVFITGATGFMGKVLVEKLLRSTDVAKVYLLIRPKKGVATQSRLRFLLETKIFDRIREENKDALRKVEAVSGDITEDRLGLSSEEESLLVESVNVVFHCAATVRFDEDLSKSIGMNVAGVLSIVSLARKMTQLKALVDVSTAYCNCDQSHIEEKIYPAPGNPKKMVEMCQWMDADILDSPEVTKKFIGNRPNTYTYTKALAESLLASESEGLPVAVMRPSIVAASWKEPFPGWVDNYNGPSGVFAAIGKGILRTVHCVRDCVADIVPVDVCINLLCSIAWETASNPSKELKVYNCTSGGINSITWGELEVMLPSSISKAAFEGAMWYPGITYQENIYFNRFYQLLFHYGPAHGVDLLCRMVGQKPYLTKVSDMMQKSTKVLEPFTTGSWDWDCNNLLALEKSLTDEDRQVFGFDLKGLNWQEYLDIYAQGIRNYVFKNDPSTQEYCRKKLVWLMMLHWLVQGGFAILILGLLFSALF